jgi:hypothetical protein
VIEQELRERIGRLLDDDTQHDWSDVSTRAAAGEGSSTPAREIHDHGRRPAARPGLRGLVAAAVVGAAIAAVPALAFSTPLRKLVGLDSVPRPVLAARLIRAPVPGSRPRRGALITVTFTVAKPGKPPGTGVARGSSFAVVVIPEPSRERLVLTQAHGANGYYRARIRWPGGRIGSIGIAGWLNVPESTIPTGGQDGIWLQVPTAP